MKHILLLFLTATVVGNVVAQSPFTTIDSVDVNNISASVLVHGDMWWSGTSLPMGQKCIYPKGTRKNIAFAGSLWISGYDASGQLHIAAQTYRQNGNDYWPGPLDASATLDYATSTNWAKIWKVEQADITSFLSEAAHTTTNIPASILTWPAKGNTYARGNADVPLTITDNMAPFIDANGNGVYEPLLGDYPAIKGDQALWWIFSDNGPTHNETDGRPLGVEVMAMSYAFKRNTLIDNVVYYEYTIRNRSANSYNNVRLAKWSDAGIGYFLDDYLGFDSAWRMVISYNATNDDGGPAGHPVNTYGLNPPQSAVTFISLPGDTETDYVPVGNRVNYNIAHVDTEYDHNIHGRLSNGDPSTPLYTGDPSDNSQLSECSLNINPGTRSYVLSGSDFSLPAGSTRKLVMALIVTDSAGGCGHTNFDNIRIVADTAWRNYRRSLLVGVHDIVTGNELNIHPNPAHNRLIIDQGLLPCVPSGINICNILGQKMAVPIMMTGKTLEADISTLAPGIYNLQYSHEQLHTHKIFVKE